MENSVRQHLLRFSLFVLSVAVLFGLPVRLAYADINSQSIEYAAFITIHLNPPRHRITAINSQ